METVQSINLIAINPEVRNGRAYILGTTVTVMDVAIAKIYRGQDVDGIADWYGLNLPQVYAALAYHYEHKPAVDDLIQDHMRRNEALWEKRRGNEDSCLEP